MLMLPNWRYEKLSWKDGIKLTIFIVVLLFVILLCMRSIERKNDAASENPVKIYKTTEFESAEFETDINTSVIENSENTDTHGSHTAIGNNDNPFVESDNSVISSTPFNANEAWQTDAHQPIRPAQTDESEDKSSQFVKRYYQRIEQYFRDREEWNNTFSQAHSERMLAGKMLIDIIPDGSAEDISEYFNTLSDEQRQQLEQKLTAQINKRDASIERLNLVKKNEPVFPSYTDLENSME